MASIISKMKKKDEQSQEKTSSTAAKKPATKKATKSDAVQMPRRQVLVKPLVSEKGTIQQAESKYFFAVERFANKIEIRQAIEALYGVNVESVRVMNMRGKRVAFNRRHGSRKAWKKAIVTLQKGQRITTVEGV